MKIALITDVHGNAAALRAVLDALEKEQVTHIYCLGDMLAIGPDSNQVLDMLFSISHVSIITGNHDECVLALLSGNEHPASHAHIKKHHQWIADRLDPSFIPLLESLPRTIKGHIGDKDFVLQHYGLSAGKQEAMIHEDPFKRIVEPSLKNMQQLFNGTDADLIGFGHHHPYHYFENDDTIYLNPGALGCQKQPMAPFALIELDEKEELHIEHKEVSYDRSEFLRSYHTLRVPDREFILDIFHGQ
ncbi:metallophosphoesterase [Halobacillus fulvus]|nr:metallophosphoesterase [Halobacillus fulvus]